MSDDKVKIPLLCCKEHETNVDQCIEGVFVAPDSKMTMAEMENLGREFYEFIYANAPVHFVCGLLKAGRGGFANQELR